MTIKTGDKLPDAILREWTGDAPAETTTAALCAGRKLVIFGLPGAFTGTCTTAHLPSFMRTKAKFVEKGFDEVICLSVNDVFVMDAWAKSTGADEAGIRMLCDPDASFTKAIGMDFTAEAVGLIDRSKRYAMVVEDGTVTLLQEEAGPGECTVSAGEAVLDAL